MSVELTTRSSEESMILYPDLTNAALFATIPQNLRDLFERYTYPWEILPVLSDYIRELGASLPRSEYEEIAPGIWVAHSAVIHPTAELTAPTIVEPGAAVHRNAYVRDRVYLAAESAVGHLCEMKNCILLNQAHAAHYNYVGDSILGNRSHLGAGVILSNLRSDRRLIEIRYKGGRVPTGVLKMGAALGDDTELGCGAVLNPGTVIGQRGVVRPLASVVGFVPSRHVYNKDGSVTPYSWE